MTQNIYWCYEKGSWGGLFVVAPTRGQAKQLFAAEVECCYIDVRTNIMKRGVNETFSGVIDDCDSPLLKKYNLEYQEEEE